ncbi:Uu.00g026930.m01.CDS01 [Anthostomella pinea]|uniref:Uu.00g026930.m01.CDS01 n=1 Tax=Anthostomella pinea TaxID=933095 RepID=A0AAI8V8M6_9PEZI|nr:Uu.00g026930.m01.CDS01 [Anthostomella pinea]
MTAKPQGISVASTIKCFDQTHYKFKTGKVPLPRVVIPLGASFELYDHDSELWVKDLGGILTFQHICGVHVPRGLQSTVMPEIQHPLPDIDGPSSYEIRANQSHCPSNMSVHKFCAFQKLFAGKERRWPNILVEMGSSNLNSSSEDTMRMLCELAVQACPRSSDYKFRIVHAVFEKPAIVKRLVELIKTRLCAISSNWREHNCMELLLTLSLRLFTLSSFSKKEAGYLIRDARDATLNWIARLREEARIAVDGDAAHRTAMYGLYAALLCRRTFSTYKYPYVMEAEELTAWVQASVALQENLVTQINTLPLTLRRFFIRDAKMAFHIQDILRDAVETHTACVGDGIVSAWSDAADGVTTRFSKWTFLTKPHNRWVYATVSDTNQAGLIFRQRVHFNLIEGHLLVNGKLPLEIRENPIVKGMFGNQHLLTYPSSLEGMTHRLADHKGGHQVHFGVQEGQVVIRALSSDGLLEYVPKSVFKSLHSFDLPSELVDSCFHWLNTTTKYLEIRQISSTWKTKESDWVMDVPRRRAKRRRVTLVDPQSSVFTQIAAIFHAFEQPEKLTVYQPDEGCMWVELRQMDLSFVKASGLLECRQLKAVIDPNQDPGTWHGLASNLCYKM